MVAERERERSIRWETMDKVERSGEGTRDVTALISSRWRRGPGRKQKAIRHQTFKLENSPAGPLPATDYPPPPPLPSLCSHSPALNLRILLFPKPHSIPAATVGV